ncbi:proliferation marker protein Ki-67-like [Gracilinanus agilis]|uniref:proliferation marker protein Ki-67-like n=1 Tax=Gracilinanus agilis TaxID=191870 RepID=UPI001CFD0FB0|nr:proliferation marker protein Ki-67-like [Gracilinanus agilis]
MQTPKEKGEPVEDLTGIKRLMRTPKEKGGSVEDLTGIKRLMRTPKEKGEPVEDLTGIKRLMQTPKEKGEPVEDLTGIKRLMQTPKEKGEPVEDLTGIKRLMRTPKEKGEPVEDLTGIKRLMRTPKEKGELVEDLTGIKRLMRTPKEKGESVEDLTGIKRLMRAPKEKGGSVEDLTGIKRLMRTPKQKGGSVEDLTGIKRLMQTPKEKGEIEKNLTNVPAFMETSKNNISSTHTIRQNNPKEVTDRDSVVSEILHEIEILRRPAIKGVSASNQENQTIEKTPELLREVPAQDKSVDRCQRQICFNPSEGGEYHNDLSNVANDIFREREEEKVKDVIENQRTITLRSRSKIKSDKEPEGSVRLFHSTRVRIKNTEKIVKTPWEENMKERVEQSSNLSQSSKIKPSEEEKKETLEGLHGKFGDMSGNKERMAPFQLRKNQARREVTSSTSSVISDVENSEKRGIMGALRSRNRNKVDTEWQEPSSPVSDDISHTVRDEKPMKVVLKEKKLKTQIMASGISLRSRKKEDKEMLSFDHLTPDSDIAYTDEEKESVKSLPEKLKGQRVVLLDSRNRNNNVREINEHDSLSSESPTGNDEKSAIVNEDKVALRTRSRNKNKVYEEKQESITTDTSCIENKGGKANGLQVQWNTTFLRTQNRIKATKESQEPDSLPNEAGKPHTEDYEKTSGKGKFAAFQEKSKSVGPSKGITRNRSKMDKESEGSIASSRDTEMNKPVKSFQENSINETIMSLRSQSKKKDTEPPLSYMTKIMSIPNNEKMPGKSLPEKKLKESPLSQDKVSLRPRTVKFEKLYPKDEKNLGKDHNLSDTTGSGGMSLRSRNKNKMETGLRGSNPVTTSEKDAQKSINTSSRMLKNSVIPHETVGRSRNKIGPQESCRLPSATEVVLVEEDKKTLSQKNLEKKLSLQVGRLDPLKTGNRNKAGQELHSLHNVTAMTATEENKEKMEKILKDQTVAKDLVSRRPRLTIKNNKEVKESMGKDEKENVAQIFPKRGIDRVSLRTSLRNKSDTDLQKSSNLNKKDPSTDAKTTTGKAQNGKHINIAFLENKKGNSRISSNIKEPTNSIQEGHFVKLSQVPDKTFKVILTSAKDTQSEPTLLRERSTLLKSTSQTQKGNDTNSQERTLRFRRKCTVKETEVLTASSKQSHINPKLTKNIKA